MEIYEAHLASANDSTPTPFLENLGIIMDFKKDSMDFSNNSFKKNSTKILNKVNVSSHIQAIAKIVDD